jgi:hypothetical protein
MSDEFDESSWELASGLPLDGATVTVTASQFGYRQDIAKETVFACLTFTPDEGEEREQCFSTGKGWELVDRGAGIARVNGRKGNINDQTGYGKWMAAALKTPGFRDAVIARRGDALRAQTWVGARFVLGTVREQTTNPSTGQSKETSRIVPTAFLGYQGDGVGANGNGASKSPSAGQESAKGAGAAVSAIDGALKAKLVGLAKGAESHDDFMAAAYDVDGVAGNAAVESAVMSTKAGSIWQLAKAE